jgi:hypothetical protein
VVPDGQPDALHLTELPEEVIVYILSFASVQTIARFSLCCKATLELAKSDYLWTGLLARDFPEVVEPGGESLSTARARYIEVSSDRIYIDGLWHFLVSPRYIFIGCVHAGSMALFVSCDSDEILLNNCKELIRIRFFADGRTERAQYACGSPVHARVPSDATVRQLRRGLEAHKAGKSVRDALGADSPLAVQLERAVAVNDTFSVCCGPWSLSRKINPTYRECVRLEHRWGQIAIDVVGGSIGWTVLFGLQSNACNTLFANTDLEPGFQKLVS